MSSGGLTCGKASPFSWLHKDKPLPDRSANLLRGSFFVGLAGKPTSKRPELWAMFP